jgi:tol-pal system protein YbgF
MKHSERVMPEYHTLLRRVARASAPALAAALVAAGAPAPLEAAANKEHLQMMADIRMLQEQNQQLQQTLGTLVEALKTVTTKIDEQSTTTRKVAADQKLLIDGLATELRIVREKLDDTNVRLGSLSQEVDSLRNSIPTMPVAPVTTPGPDAATPGGTDPGAAASSTAAPPAGAAPNPIAGMSPSKLFDLAYSDYAAGQFALAIQGFETYLRAFPRTPQSDDAQFYIGEAYQLDGKNADAIKAFDRVIADYPTGDRTADAYYKRGVVYSAMNQPDRARESFEATIKNFPDSQASRLAKQQLDKVGRR